MVIDKQCYAVTTSIGGIKCPIVHIGCNIFLSLAHRESQGTSAPFSDNIVLVIFKRFLSNNEAKSIRNMGVPSNETLSFSIEINSSTFRFDLSQTEGADTDIFFKTFTRSV